MPKYHVAKGFQLLINEKSAGSVTSIGGVEVTKDTEETTAVTSVDGYRTYMATYADGGEVPIEGMCDLEDEGQNELKANVDTVDEIPVEIVFPPAMKLKWKFNAILTRYKLGEGSVGSLMKFSATFKISGRPALVAVTGGTAGNGGGA